MMIGEELKFPSEKGYSGLAFVVAAICGEPRRLNPKL